MRKILIAFGAVLALAACAQMQAAAPKTAAQIVFDARAAFDAGPLVAAAGYVSLPACPQADGKPCADHEVVVKIAKAKTVAIAAWDAAEETVRANPKTDAETAMMAATNATAVLKSVLDQYFVK